MPPRFAPTRALFRFQLRLWHLFVVMTVIATAVALGAQAHWSVSILVLSYCLLLAASFRWKRLAFAVLPPLLIVTVIMLMPSLGPPPHHSLAIARQSNLKQLGYALWNYHDQHGSYPPAVVKGPAGNPLYSWRVLLLPYLEEKPLYDAFHLDEPWDSPHNLALADQMPAVFGCPREGALKPKQVTDFVAITGDETVWPADQGVTFSDIADGTSSTLAVVEWPGSNVVWTAPTDLPMSNVKRWWHAGHSGRLSEQGRVILLFVDGHMERVDRATLTAPQLRALLTRAAKDGAALQGGS